MYFCSSIECGGPSAPPEGGSEGLRVQRGVEGLLGGIKVSSEGGRGPPEGGRGSPEGGRGPPEGGREPPEGGRGPPEGG